MKDKIDDYWALDAYEREEVERFVDVHPKLLPALRRAKAFAAIIDDAAPDAKPTDDELARFVAREAFSDEGGLHADDVTRIGRALDEDTELRERARDYSNRLADLQGHDAGAHFRRVVSEAASSGQTGRSGPGSPARRVTTVAHVAVRRLAIAAVLAFAALAVSFVLLQVATTSDLDKLAAFRTDEVDPSQYRLTLRSGPTESAAPVDTLFLDAVDILRGAQRSYFGLFYKYDMEGLSRAGEKLQAYVDALEDDTYLTLEARYLLAKVRIHEGRLNGAVYELDRVVDGGGGRTSRARALREEILENEE